MPPFPFRRLPLLAQLEIVRNARCPDLLRLSTCSKKVDELIQFANISLENFEIVINEDEVLMDFDFPRTECKFEIKVVSDKIWKGNSQLSLAEGSDSQGSFWLLDILVGEKDFLVTVDETVYLLMRLFKRTELVWLMFEPLDIASILMRKVVQPHFSTVQCLIVEEEKEGERLMEDEIRWTLENIKVIKQVLILSSCHGPASYSRSFETEFVYVKYPSWIHLDDVINSTTQTFDFSYSSLPSIEILKAILMAWISSEKLINLKCLTWETDWRNDVVYPEDFANEVMEGIEEAVLTQEDRILNPFEDEEEEEDGQYVRRADGVLAVVTMNLTIFKLRIC